MVILVPIYRFPTARTYTCAVSTQTLFHLRRFTIPDCCASATVLAWLTTVDSPLLPACDYPVDSRCYSLPTTTTATTTPPYRCRYDCGGTGMELDSSAPFSVVFPGCSRNSWLHHTTPPLPHMVIAGSQT